MMTINFFENGIEIIYSNGKKSFIAYQSFVKITDVYINIDESNYDWLSGYFVSDKVSKYAAFKIYLSNKEEVEIIGGSKSFRRYDDEDTKKMNWFQRIFLSDLNKQGLDKKAEEWLKNRPLDMFNEVYETKMMREKFLEKFNNWKNF